MKNKQSERKNEDRNSLQDQERTGNLNTRKEGNLSEKGIRSERGEEEETGTKMPGRDTRTPVAGREAEDRKRESEDRNRRTDDNRRNL